MEGACGIASAASGFGRCWGSDGRAGELNQPDALGRADQQKAPRAPLLTPAATLANAHTASVTSEIGKAARANSRAGPSRKWKGPVQRQFVAPDAHHHSL